MNPRYGNFWQPRYWPAWLVLAILRVVVLLPQTLRMAFGRGLGRLGSVVLDVDGHHLVAQFVDDAGAVRDRFEPLSTRLQRPRDRAAVARIGSQLYVACGRREDTLEQISLNDFSSRVVASLPGGPREGAQLVALDQTLLLYGGGNSTLDVVYLANNRTDL